MKESIKKRAPKSKTPTTVIFQARLSYVHLDQPWAGAEGNEPKYSVSCIIPKDDVETVAAIEKAIDTAVREGVTKIWKGKTPNVRASNFKYPLKDGDVERPDDEAYAGCMFLGANSKKPVPCFNRLQERIDPQEVYSGCWALVQVGFFPFDQGSKGVGAGLNAVLKVADDDRLGGGEASASDFDGMGLDDGKDDLLDL